MLVGLHVPTNFQMYRQDSEKALLGGNCPPPPPAPLWLRYWGEGARPPNVPTEKKLHVTYMRERLRNHIFRFQNQCSSLLLLVVWRYKRHYIEKKKLTLRTVYEYASLENFRILTF